MITRSLWLAGVASVGLFAGIAYAEEVPADPAQNYQPADSAASGDNQIVVTARRREEAIQDVPLAIAVINSDALEQTGSFNVGKLQQLQPTIQFYSSNPRNSAANIRGLGAPFGLTNDGIEQGVGIYVDEVYYSRAASSTFDFLDVGQIEVLRGPQGTLYGKNVTAGAINITSRAPSFDFEGRAEATYGNLGFVQAKASVSGPLIADRLAVRLAASSTHRRGTIYNVATGNNINEQDNIGFKAQLLWKASDDLNITLAGDYNRQDPECCAQIYYGLGDTQRRADRQYPGLVAAYNADHPTAPYAVPSTNIFDRVTDVDANLRARQSLGGVSLKAKWDLGAGELTSITAWRFWNWLPSNDRDFTGLPIFTKVNNPSKQRQWTQEFRYAQTGDKVDFVVGLFGFHQKVHTDGIQTLGSAASKWLLSPSNANYNNPAYLDGVQSDNSIDFKNTSLAAFGQLSWKVTDSLRLQPGIRINYDKKDGSYISVVTQNGGPTTSAQRKDAGLPNLSYQPEFSDWNLSYDFTASYDVTRDILAYATYARSFKSGGINLNGVPTDSVTGLPIESTYTVKPEKVNHFELGLKTQLFDRKATLNLSGFWTDIRNFQAIVNDNTPGLVRGYLANAQKVRVRGAELDFSARPTDALNIYANGAYTDATYKKFTNSPCPPELTGGTVVTGSQTPDGPGVHGATTNGLSPYQCDISGSWLPGVSKWALSFGGEYRVPAKLLGQDGEFYLGYDASYRSKFSSNPARSIYMDVKGYDLHNFRLGYRVDKGWDIYGWVRNAFDKKYIEQLATQSGSTGLIIGQPGDPRTYGLTVKANF